MYIRTVIGNILKNPNIIYPNYANGKGYISNEYRTLIGIKSQGDNLIDVLELDDIIEFNDPRYTNEVYREQYFIISIDSTYSVSDIARKDIQLSDNYWRSVNDLLKLDLKIITYEQYMPLAQEVL